MRFLDLALCIFLLAMAIFFLRLDVHDFQEYRRIQSEATSPFDNPAPLAYVSGYDSQGKEVSTLPLGAKNVALFILHGSNFQKEVALWNSIADHATDEIKFAGMCDNAACIQQMTEARGKLHFSSQAYGDYLPLRGLMRVDAHGQIEILNRENGAIKVVSRPKSFAEFAEIQAGIKEGL